MAMQLINKDWWKVKIILRLPGKVLGGNGYNRPGARESLTSAG
jgi:hypothetical protein